MALTMAMAIAGLLVSIVSALENRVQWIASFCSVFGEGCRRTQDFTLLRIPVAWWGIGYYAVLAAAVPLAADGVFWLVAAGLGFELTFVWIMFRIRAFCIFCTFNAVVVAALVWAVYDPARLWQGTTLALAVFIGSRALLAWENMPRMAPPGRQAAFAEAADAAEERPRTGPQDAPVVVVEYSDPFCPACRKVHAATRAVRAAYQDRVRWVFKDFPLEMHPGAKTAAAAAHCAGAQGRFWEYHALLYEAEGQPDEAALKDLAATLGLDTQAFARCLDEGRYREQVEEDLKSGRDAGVTATPTFFINGEMVSGSQSQEEFQEKIEAALAAAEDREGAWQSDVDASAAS